MPSTRYQFLPSFKQQSTEAVGAARKQQPSWVGTGTKAGSVTATSAATVTQQKVCLQWAILLPSNWLARRRVCLRRRVWKTEDAAAACPYHGEAEPSCVLGNHRLMSGIHFVLFLPILPHFIQIEPPLWTTLGQLWAVLGHFRPFQLTKKTTGRPLLPFRPS